MQTRIRHGQPELWIRLVEAVAVLGLCVSIGLSVWLQRVEVSIMADVDHAQAALAASTKRCPISAPATTLDSRAISQITGQADVLNRILTGGLVFNAKKNGSVDTGFDLVNGGAL